MEFYQKGYYLLFNGITDALDAMEKQNYGLAAELLCQAQEKAEESYLSDTDEPGEGVPEE